MPTRVLDVQTGNTGEVRLYEPQGQSGHYVCLSYCWGCPQLFATTLKCYNSYVQGIKIDTLPTTIQDAIWVTRQLNVRYLWVDSLCIIQDSIQDKENQISRMADVYANSYLTISAARGKRCTDGLFNVVHHDFDPGVFQNVSAGQLRFYEEHWFRYRDLVAGAHCSLRLGDAAGDIGQFKLRYFLNAFPDMDSVSTRAWIFQESVLSPRVLSFGQCLTFDCFVSTELDRCTGDRAGSSFARLVSRWLSESSSPSDAKAMWSLIVQAYTERSLSVPTDKLPALAGLATAFKNQFSYPADDYVAGLWKSMLPQCLMWLVSNPGKRPQSWRAPSWSWASVEGNVMMSPEETKDLELASEVVICNVVPLSESTPFAKVKSGSLVIKGLLMQAPDRLLDLKKPRRGWAQLGVNNGKLCYADTHSNVPMSNTRLHFLDTIEEFDLGASAVAKIMSGSVSIADDSQPSPLFLLPIRRSRLSSGLPSIAKPDKRYQGLLLRRVHADTYKRVGWFQIFDRDIGQLQWDAPQHIHIV